MHHVKNSKPHLFNIGLSHKTLITHLFKKEMQAQFREAVLGYFWLILPTLTIAVSFTLANQASFIATDRTSIPYPAYLVISIVLWQLFSESLMAPIIAIDKAKKILTRVTVPPQVFILSKMLEVYTHFALKMAFAICVIGYYSLPLAWHTILLFPIACILLSLFGLFIGTLITPFSVLYRDILQSLPMILGFLMFLTPVVYESPKENSLFSKVVNLNPITPLLVKTREFLVYTENPYSLVYYGGVVVAIFILGVLSHRVLRFSWPTIIDRIGN